MHWIWVVVKENTQLPWRRKDGKLLEWILYAKPLKTRKTLLKNRELPTKQNSLLEMSPGWKIYSFRNLMLRLILAAFIC